MNEYDIINFDTLYKSAQKCKHGVMWKTSVANYMLNIMKETLKLAKELTTGTYIEQPKKIFTVKCPKEREIVSIKFRDRVYQRALNDDIIYPSIAPTLIYDNCACQKKERYGFCKKTHEGSLTKTV